MSHRDREAVLAEDLNSAVESLMDLAVERGLSARRLHEPPVGETTETPQQETPDITDLLRDELRAALEEDLVPAVDAGPETRIREDDVQREIVKKALVGLKLHTLQKIAVEHRLDRRGRSEEVAERIGRAYRFDQQAVARLILENEEEPSPERGYTTRLFPIARPVDIAATSQRLQPLVNRYIRIGVARWFVVAELLHAADTRLKVFSSVRSYQAFVNDEGEQPSLGAAPSTSDLEVDLRSGAKTVGAHGATAFVARSAMLGLRFASDLEIVGYVPTPSVSGAGRLMSFDPRTVLLLDVVYNRLARVGVRSQNLTIAKFQTSDEERQAPEEAERPTLRAVRFEGDHILDSQQACALIDRESRGLVDISMWVEAEVGTGEESCAWFPIRLSIERDHVAVITGYGRHRPELAATLQAKVVREVCEAIEAGPSNMKRLVALANEIHEIAMAPTAEERRLGQIDQ